uniref:Uncharacterized protein n=1 Tax=Salix viminalis TaxID=40686 RepID=A0A6N2NM74_SALVM
MDVIPSDVSYLISAISPNHQKLDLHFSSSSITPHLARYHTVTQLWDILPERMDAKTLEGKRYYMKEKMIEMTS